MRSEIFPSSAVLRETLVKPGPNKEGARSTNEGTMSKPRGVVEPSMVAVSVNEYVGDVSRAGYYEGHGVAHFRAGHRYEGGFSKGKMSGVGRYEWVDGIVYEGDFVDNVATGVGKYTWPDGATYTGEVRRGLRHGRGVQAFADGRVTYDGEWKDGMRHGIGTLTFDADGYARYEGEWRDDRKHGKGRMQYASGNWYEGGWACDQKNGRGVMCWPTSGETYDGDWVDGKPHGVGTHAWDRVLSDTTDALTNTWFNTRNSYRGQFAAGMRQGYGRFAYANGSTYDGNWYADRKHGDGAYTFEDGSVFVGRFERDRPVLGEDTGGSARFEPTDHLRLDVADLMSEEEQARDDEPATSLDFTLKRYSSELRAIYRRAAAAGASIDPDERHARHPERNPTPLSVPGFVRLMRRAGVAGADVTCVQLARAAHVAWRDSPPVMEPGDPDESLKSREERRLKHERDARRGNVMDPNGSMVYRQFAEACVRVAHVKFNEAFGLDRRAEHLIVEHLLPSELDEALDESRTLPWDAKMADAEVRESAEAKAETYFREVRGTAGGDDDDANDEPRLATPTATGRAFLRWLKSKGALADGDEGGEPVTWPPPEPVPETDPGGDGGDEEEKAADGDAATTGGAGDEEEGEKTEEGAEEKAPPAPSLTTLQALTAFYRAIGPVAAAAEEEAAEEEAARARYEAEEAAAAAGVENGEPEEDAARESARLDAEATRLARAVDCEAMFPEFFEALGRCADAAVKTEGASLAEKLATFFAEVVDGTPAVASA